MEAAAGNREWEPREIYMRGKCGSISSAQKLALISKPQKIISLRLISDWANTIWYSQSYLNDCL